MYPNSYYIFVILIVVNGSMCANTTASFNTMDSKNFQSKSNRLLSFNTEDDGNISMELAFNVPFITIPVKKSLDMAKGAIANVNIGAIILAGAITFGFAVVIPGILFLMGKKKYYGYEQRSEDAQNEWLVYLQLLEQVLSENNIDTTSCVQKMVCWAVKNSAENVSKGTSSSMDKIIDGLATSTWLQSFVQGSVVEAAMKNGLDAINCSKEYRQCKLGERMIQIFAKKFSTVINNVV